MARTKEVRDYSAQCKTAKNIRTKVQMENTKQKHEILGKRLSIEEARSFVPRNFRSQITEKFLDQMEQAIGNDEQARHVRENFITYSKVLQDCDPNVNILDYLNAVRFITFKIMGYSAEESWKRVFPHKVEKLLREGNEKHINKYANIYNKSQIVNKIYSQTMIPSYILHHEEYEKMISTLNDMIYSGELRGMAKVKAVEIFLSNTKPPEVAKAELQVSIQQSDTITDLRDATDKFARAMRLAIEEGKTTATEIIEADWKELVGEKENVITE